jgi:hypothetical protein
MTENQCTATAKSTGERCKRPAIKGGTVCYQHGGAAPQVQQKAQERLDSMADDVTADMEAAISDLFDQLEDIEDPEQQLAMMRELRQQWVAILDRTGHGPTETTEMTGEGGGEIVFNLADED